MNAVTKLRSSLRSVGSVPSTDTAPHALTRGAPGYMNVSLASKDRELIQQLLEDVGVLESQFSTGLPKPQTARAILAPILRRWIAEGLFYQAQKLIRPEQVGFPIVSSGKAVKLCKAGVYVHWMGLLVFDTISVGVGQVASKYIGPDGKPTIQLHDGMPPRPTSQKPSIFFGQRLFFWKGKFYTRTDVIKMHANILGGVHFDFSKAQDQKHINEIKNYFGFELKGTTSQMLIGDEIGIGRADADRRDRIYDAMELVAMDTARIFTSGIRASEKIFVALLA
jgi:hypothetical protein